jgi:hypothetical protein
MPATRRRALALPLALALGAAALGCQPGAASAPEPGDGRAALGATPAVFGLRPEAPEGTGVAPSGLELRWEDRGGTQVVVGVAERWDPARQASFLRGGESLRGLADGYARRWGASDARLVSESLAGGIQFLHYRSTSLRSALGGAGDEAARRGRFFVAITLDPHAGGGPVPFAAERVGAPGEHGRIFTVAVVAGLPWTA